MTTSSFTRAVASLAVLLASASTALSQAYTVRLHQPPPNKLRVADMWRVDLMNPTGKPVTVYLHGTATESKSGKLIVDAQTKPFILGPGMSTPTGSQFGQVQVNSSDPRYRDIVLETGTVPSGDYTVCVYLMDQASNEELANDCIDIHVEQFTPPVLLQPTDGDEVDDPNIIFTWVPPAPLVPGAHFTYELRITEVLGKQAPVEAMQRNNPWYDQQEIRAPVSQYPATARAFQEGQTYAWKIVAFLNGLPAGESETWTFTRKKKLVDIRREVLRPVWPVRDARGGLASSVAIGRDSNVYAWGDNSKGQLGITGATQETEATLVPNLHAVKAVASGGSHSLALLNNGQIYAWGNNDYGQLGDGSITDRTAPGLVPVVPAADQIAAGEHFSIALTKAGSVYFWGYNRSGESGFGKMEDSIDVLKPGFVPGMSSVVGIAAGADHAVAVGGKGSVWAWGSNVYGQCGVEGKTTPQYTPVAVHGYTPAAGTGAPINAMKGAYAVAAGRYHSLILRYDGTVWAWGDNSSGQLGDGTRLTRAVVKQVQGLTDVIDIAAGGAFSMALRQDSTVWVWGGNQWSALGLGPTDSARTVPVQIPGLTKVVHIGCGEGHAFAITSTGVLWSWGENTYAQAGTGAASDPNNPSASDPTKPTAVKRAAK